jgi:hypothetical protein
MTNSTRRRRRGIPVITAELMLASWQTIAYRTLMIAKNTCPPAEYERMTMEKLAAVQRSTLALISGRGARTVLAPWHRSATANAKRLRRKR